MSGVEEAPGCQLDRILAEGRTGRSDTRVGIFLNWISSTLAKIGDAYIAGRDGHQVEVWEHGDTCWSWHRTDFMSLATPVSWFSVFSAQSSQSDLSMASDWLESPSFPAMGSSPFNTHWSQTLSLHTTAACLFEHRWCFLKLPSLPPIIRMSISSSFNWFMSWTGPSLHHDDSLFVNGHHYEMLFNDSHS